MVLGAKFCRSNPTEARSRKVVMYLNQFVILGICVYLSVVTWGFFYIRKRYILMSREAEELFSKWSETLDVAKGYREEIRRLKRKAVK